MMRMTCNSMKRLSVVIVILMMPLDGGLVKRICKPVINPYSFGLMINYLLNVMLMMPISPSVVNNERDKANNYRCRSYVYAPDGHGFSPLAQINGRRRGGEIYYDRGHCRSY